MTVRKRGSFRLSSKTAKKRVDTFRLIPYGPPVNTERGPEFTISGFFIVCD